MKLLAPIVNDDDIVNKKYVDTAADKLQSQVNNKADKEHNHDNRYYTESEVDSKVSGINKTISDHISNTSNPHGVTKSQVGLSNVENKSSATIRGEITKSNVTTALGYTPLNQSLKGSVNGLAELDSNGKVPSSQLPSFVDDVVEGYLSGGKFYKESAHTTEIKGETGKIYIDLSTEKTYRWSGSAFVVISETLALGETSSTAYRGDRGKIAYDHSQSAHARTDATKVEASSTNGNIKINGTETTVYKHPSGTNPHGTTKSDVGLGNVGNFKAVSTVANQGLTDTEKANARANIGAGTSSFSGSYNDLTNKPTIPTVGNGTITIKQKGVTKGTFTTNQSGNTTIELTDDNTTYGVATTSALGLVKSGTDITVDSNGNVSINDDSHNHVISNIDGLQSALNGKQNIRNGTVSVVDWNTLVTPGSYKIQGSTMTTDYHAPVGEYQFGILFVIDSEGNTGEHRILQLYFPHNSLKFPIWYRMNNSSDGYDKWGKWSGISRDADTLDGNHASAFATASHTHTKSQITDFPASLPANGGNADTATSATKATQDESGNNIKSSYASSISISDHTITLKNKNGTSLGTVNVPNNDTKVTQTVTTSNASYPLLLAPSGQTATATTTSYFDSGVTLNPSTNTIAANISGSASGATYAYKIANRGRHAETASGTTANTPTAGMLETSGLFMTETYQDSATPTGYGNIINIAGAGTGQLLCEWSGADNTLGHLYYRSHRDTSTGGWSNWGKVAFTTDNVATATKLATARTIALTGSVTGSGTFDGSGNLSIATTTNHTHNYAGSSSAGGSANSSLVLTKNSSFNDDSTGRVSYYDADITNTTNNASWSAPSSGWHQIYHNDLSVANYWTELAFPVNGVDGLAWRQRRNNAYFGWYRILDSNNYKSYCTPANIGAAASSHTHSYAGSSSAGGSATSAVSVVDYGNTSKTIKIGFGGAGATTSNLAYIAGYLSGNGETRIKDVSKDTLKSWLGLGSAAYTNSSAYAASSHKHAKSDITDMPTSLPANGGNADTVDGKHASDFFNYIGTVADLFAVNQTCVCRYDENTLNTPYKAGLTGSTVGLCFVNCEAGTAWVSYLVISCGDPTYYVVTTSNGNLTTSWRKINDNGHANLSTSLYMPRVVQADANWLPDTGERTMMREFSSDSANLPNANWYHILASRSADTRFGSQLAIGMTTDDLYYRADYAGNFSTWKRAGVKVSYGSPNTTFEYQTGYTKCKLEFWKKFSINPSTYGTAYSSESVVGLSNSMTAINGKNVDAGPNYNFIYSVSTSGAITISGNFDVCSLTYYN